MMHSIVETQRTFFNSGTTRDMAFRKKQLAQLRDALITHEQELLDALFQDLNKPRNEAYWSEIYYTLQEISRALDNLSCWAKNTSVSTPWYLFPARSFIQYEPRGVVVIFSPWNYPVQLLLVPLVGALAAGNCAALKPSEHAPRTSALLADIIASSFDPAHVTVVQGGPEEAQALLKEKFDYIFFTGSTNIGKKVMHAAAEQLTPLTLELGGQNPCIVTTDTDLDVTAQRIVRGKFSNAGQSCIAPNYLLVHASIKDTLVERLTHYIKEWYGDDAHNQRLVNEKHFKRVKSFLVDCTIITGGTVDEERLYISPTLIEGFDEDHAALHEEIFGPVLPLVTYESLDEAVAFINNRPKPLALYLFSKNQELQQRIVSRTTSGGVSINDIGLQFLHHGLPFGGIGDSGFGAYHGKKSFITFSHAKSVARTSLWPRFSIVHFIRYQAGSWIRMFTDWLVS